jgi:Acetyl-CoA hydrolase
VLREILRNLDVQEEYAHKLITAREAAALVKSGDWLDYSLSCGQPIEIDKALALRAPELRNVKVRSAVSLRMPEIMKGDDAGEHFKWHSLHLSNIDRQVIDKGWGSYIPIRLSETPRYYRENIDPIDISIFQVCPMDVHGYFSLGPQITWLMAALENSKMIIFEVNQNMPRTLGGYDDKLHISQIDYVVAGPNSPIITVPPAEPGEVENKIALYIVNEIPDGANLQLGIGGMPNAVGSIIAQSDLRDLGVHTELYVDALLKITEAGKINGRKKSIDRGVQVYCFAFGSEELYKFLDNNPECAAYPGDYTNDPYIIGQLDKFMSINNAIEVDLFGQVCSESDGTRQISGNGGQADFVMGAYRSKGGKSFICLASTYEKEGQLRSRINPILKPGAVITSNRTTTHFVVTEYGIINLKGKSTWERAEALVSIAHPRFRDQLVKDAEELRIWTKTNKNI